MGTLGCLKKGTQLCCNGLNLRFGFCLIWREILAKMVDEEVFVKDDGAGFVGQWQARWDTLF